MSNTNHRKKYPLVPPQESRCVWMTAGILSYELCDREFDCEHCPLDAALRTRFAGRGVPLPEGQAKDAAATRRSELESQYEYGRKHTWVKRLDRSMARIGIEPGLASALLSPRAVVLPAIGGRVLQNRVCAWIVMAGGTLPICAPIDGEVKNTNVRLLENPHTVSGAPLHEGWLFDLLTDQESFDRAELLGIAEAAKVFTSDESRFQSLIAAELGKAGTAAGATLADGGQVLQNVVAMVGPKKYFRLVREAFT